MVLYVAHEDTVQTVLTYLKLLYNHTLTQAVSHVEKSSEVVYLETCEYSTFKNAMWNLIKEV